MPACQQGAQMAVCSWERILVNFFVLHIIISIFVQNPIVMLLNQISSMLFQ